LELVRSVLLGTLGLSAAALVALVLTLTRRNLRASDGQLKVTTRRATAALLLQVAHVAEEIATSFHRRFPEALDLVPWPVGFFLSFNLFWLALWALSIWGLAARQHAALFPLWFLALASLANGIAHPLLSLNTGGYFPGVVSSPLVGLAGLLLMRRLTEITSDAQPALA
jgi:hypothetical protein